MTEPQDVLAEIEARHVEAPAHRGITAYCKYDGDKWPCDVIRLAALVRTPETQLGQTVDAESFRTVVEQREFAEALVVQLRGELVALRAATPETLDVERLAAVLRDTYKVKFSLAGDGDWRSDAEYVAAGYNAATASPTPPGRDWRNDRIASPAPDPGAGLADFDPHDTRAMTRAAITTRDAMNELRNSALQAAPSAEPPETT